MAMSRKQRQLKLRSTLELCDVAKHVFIPKGAVDTYWPGVEARLADLETSFDRWQSDIAQLILALRRDGKFVAAQGGVVLSIPRQTGKTFMVSWIVFALATMFPGLQVLWTSHHSATTQQTVADFEGIAAMPEAKQFFNQRRGRGGVINSNGKEAVYFANGSWVKFGARGQGFGRGFKKIDVLIFDEAQILPSRALDDMIPSQNNADNPLLILMGTPPRPEDPGEVFSYRRKRAISGKGNSVYVEIGADPVPEGVDPSAWMMDKAQWEKGCPGYRTGRTSEDAMLRQMEFLTSEGPDSFLREALGIWDADTAREEAIPKQWWLDATVEPLDDMIVTDFTVCFAGMRGRSNWVFVARCGETEGGWS